MYKKYRANYRSFYTGLYATSVSYYGFVQHTNASFSVPYQVKIYEVFDFGSSRSFYSAIRVTDVSLLGKLKRQTDKMQSVMGPVLAMINEACKSR